MTFVLTLALLHIVGALVWAASAIVSALILRVARRDDASALRALSETAVLSRRVLRPSIVVTTFSGLALAAQGGLLAEAWVVLSTALAIGALVAETFVVAPECRHAAGMPQGAALERGRRALDIAGRSLAGQAGALVLMVVTPGWSGAAILAGLVACLVMAAGLLPEAEAGSSSLA